MTARLPANPDGLNRFGNGRGVGVATAQKRGERVKRGEAKTRPLNIAEVRSRGIDTSTLAGIALIDPDKPLTDLQKNFVKLWAQGETILSAAIKAGYTDGGTYAYRLVRMPNVLALYNEEKRQYEAAGQMTRKKVMDGLQDGIAMATLLGEPASVIAGWREVGRLCGYYEPVTVKHQVTVDGKVMVDRMNRMSDAELFRIIQENAAQIASTQEALPAPEDVEDVDAG